MTPISQLEPAAARELLETRGDRAVLLDVREPWEYDLVHVEGARLIPMGELQQRLGELDPSLEYVVICHHGRRSQIVAQFMASHGYARVANLAGGIEAWADLDPSLERY